MREILCILSVLIFIGILGLIANNIITARLVIDIPNFDDLVFEYALKR